MGIQKLSRDNLNVDSLIRFNSSRKQKTKLKRLMEVKRYFLSLYRCYCVMMYDKNYLRDPTRFNEKEIIKNMVDMGIDDTINHVGRVDLSSEHILFAFLKNRDNKEKSEFLELLYYMLRYREFSIKIDRVYEEYGFREDSAVIKTNMVAKGGLITQKSGIVFDEALARCISTFDTDTHSISINEQIWALAMEELNIPEEDWEKDGLFESSLSHKEEVLCMEGILNGVFRVSGKYSDVLKTWLYAHRWSNDAVYKADMKGLYDYIYSSRVSDIIRILNSALLEAYDCGYTVLAIEKDKIFYNECRTSYKMPYGIFTVMCDSDNEESILPSVNILNGFTGEVYTESRLIEDGNSYVGCPIYLNISKGKSVAFYDLEQTDIEGDSWFISNNVDISFGSVDIINEFKKGSTSYDIYQGYIDSLTNPESLIGSVRVSNYEDYISSKKEVQKKIEE